MTQSDRDRIRQRFADFLGPGGVEAHPLYAAICDKAQSDDLFAELICEAPAAQRRPNILLAALHDLALGDPASDLAGLYPTARWLHGLECGIDADPADPSPGVDVGADLGAEGLVAVMAACHDQRDQLVETIATRRTQTNEVGRSAPLLAGLGALAGADETVSLIDLGCSAGLNLIPDSYRAQLAVGTTLGDPSSRVELRCEQRGGEPPRSAPSLGFRAGVDLDPPDLADDLDARWVLACQWPDDVDRFERTRRAISLWRRSDHRPTVLSGDLVESLPSLIEGAPGDAPIVIHHSWVAAYLEEEQQQDLARTIRGFMDERPISWLWLEHPREVPGLSPPKATSARIPGSSLLVAEPAKGPSRVLAQAHPHGSWMSWDS